MRAHVFHHVPFETVGSIGPWLAAHHAVVGNTRFYESPVLPEANAIDLLVVMGGPLSANDEAEFPWLRAEKQFIRDAIARGKAVLGICLGSQLIASALGARVYKNAFAEHGWLPVDGIATGPGSFHFPPTFTTFQSHGETFDLPAGAVQLARSAACEQQAYQVGRNVIGLQFHLESNPESAGAIVEHCANEFAPGPYVQSTASLRAFPASAYAESIRLMGEVLAYLAHPAP